MAFKHIKKINDKYIDLVTSEEFKGKVIKDLEIEDVIEELEQETNKIRKMKLERKVNHDGGLIVVLSEVNN